MNDRAPFADDRGPSPERQAKLFALLYSADEVEIRTRRIYESMLSQSPRIRSGNFTRMDANDLHRLFGWYDSGFFRGRLGEMLHEDGAHPMTFGLSARLVRAAGQTVRNQQRIGHGLASGFKIDYEINVSTTLLYNTFQTKERTVTVGGLVCADRLEALQRIFEHELLHLAEFLGWGRSNCRAGNFSALSKRIFAHEAAYHDLITPREHAWVAFDIHVGDLVHFEADGRRHVGRVSRITSRATVLVENPREGRDSNGQHCLKFYVPLPLLRKAQPDPES